MLGEQPLSEELVAGEVGDCMEQLAERGIRVVAGWPGGLLGLCAGEREIECVIERVRERGRVGEIKMNSG